MLAQGVDHKILGYLGRALSLELSAVQTYSTQARLAATWGLDGPAGKFRKEAQEEMEHAERIIARMLALGVAPNASILRPAAIGEDLLALLKADQAFELELAQLYSDAARHCARMGSRDDKIFFQNLLEEELVHAHELEEWIKEIEPEATPPQPEPRRIGARWNGGAQAKAPRQRSARSARL